MRNQTEGGDRCSKILPAMTVAQTQGIYQPAEASKHEAFFAAGAGRDAC